MAGTRLSVEDKKTMCMNFELGVIDVKIAKMLTPERGKSTVGRYRKLHDAGLCECGGGVEGAEAVNPGWSDAAIRDKASELMMKGEWADAARALRCAEMVLKIESHSRSSGGFSHDDVERMLVNSMDSYELAALDVFGQEVSGDLISKAFDAGRTAVMVMLESDDSE